jgi:hypothetical protein
MRRKQGRNLDHHLSTVAASPAEPGGPIRALGKQKGFVENRLDLMNGGHSKNLPVMSREKGEGCLILQPAIKRRETGSLCWPGQAAATPV